MTYTFSTRKELNRLLMRQCPGHCFQEDKNGIPRMRTDKLPPKSQEVLDIDELCTLASDYWDIHHRPMPVFLSFRTESWQEPQPIEVNYVSHRSISSVTEASRYISNHRLFVLPLLLPL